MSFVKPPVDPNDPVDTERYMNESYYILADDRVTPVSIGEAWPNDTHDDRLMKWAIWKRQNGVIVQTNFGGLGFLSTVFLANDHNWGIREKPEDPHRPLLYESMMFGGPFGEAQIRDWTWPRAVARHRQAWKAMMKALAVLAVEFDFNDAALDTYIRLVKWPDMVKRFPKLRDVAIPAWLTPEWR